MDYKQKYIKYKNKYLAFQKQIEIEKTNNLQKGGAVEVTDGYKWYEYRPFSDNTYFGKNPKLAITPYFTIVDPVDLIIINTNVPNLDEIINWFHRDYLFIDKVSFGTIVSDFLRQYGILFQKYPYKVFIENPVSNNIKHFHDFVEEYHQARAFYS